MGARAEQLHALLPDDRVNGAEGGSEIVHRLRGGVADAGDDFHRVAQQFLVHVRVFADFSENRGGFVAQVAGLRVNERELPFDAKCRAG